MKVLITGAAGAIGSTLREGLRGRYETLRLTDNRDLGEAREGEETVLADLTEIGGLIEAMRGVDAVVHMGGIPNEHTYETIRTVNMDGTHNVYEAARLADVKRVVFASSIHAVGFYERDERNKIGPNAPVRPDTFYGVSKVFGEALGRLYWEKHGIETAALRICSFLPRPQERRNLSTWLSPRDCVSLVAACLDTPRLGFKILAGISANTRAWMTSEGWADVGYHPQDNAEDYASDIERIHGDENDLTEQRQGGVFVAKDYVGLARQEVKK
ncbi:NAD-dependent epimerase/dehydratase family protein [Deinococcus yavapaiensis]|uniref:Uronate dehydrogenase n=1 Tax=Deinococcus yavapaiensis KR-236 TaxID=694435 RepID=A0A318S5U0_9DEIO|nr:NAD(P)-dependent oxidoreductase [Deinococcus yavapaiensis]PYE53512.1 uronate dehydrogenase [Deinococcus yavapaiensis KR-236]